VVPRRILSDEVADDSQRIDVPLVWVGIDETPIVFANQVLAQFFSEEFVLTFGQSFPPPILGATEEERRKQAEELPYVAVRPVARLSLNERRMRELVDILQKNLEMFERSEDT
jgi:hypothetical protein